MDSIVLMKFKKLVFHFIAISVTTLLIYVLLVSMLRASLKIITLQHNTYNSNSHST